MTIGDCSKAEAYLLENNYYNVINKYGFMFQIQGTNKFIPNSTLDEIRNLQFLDKELRNLFMSHLTAAEERIKSIISHSFAEDHQDKYAYLNPCNFANNSKKDVYDLINAFIKMLKKYSNKKTHPIGHYISAHQEVPLWVIINFVYFYDSINFFDCLNIKEQEKAADKLLEHYNATYPTKKCVIVPGILHKIMENFSSFRNLCAHNSRIIGTKIRNDFPHTQWVYGQTKKVDTKSLYDLYLNLELILHRNDYAILHNTLLNRFKQKASKFHTISINDIYDKLGFPNDWHKNTPKMNQDR